MNYLLSYQFRAFFAKFQAIVKMAVAVEGFLHVQEMFCEVLLKENGDIKNELDFLCWSNHSEDCLLFLSKKAKFLTV